MGAAEAVVDDLRGFLGRTDPGGVVGTYLHGSSVLGGLRPDSDIDVLVLTRRTLTQPDRRSLTAFLLQFSGRRATLTPGRPLEVTSLVVVDDVVPWRYPPTCDYLYGEWLRDQYLGGDLPRRHPSPDLAILLTTARDHAEALSGPALGTLLAPVPGGDLRRAVQDSLEPLLENLVGDERNVLLTLARMVVTVRTGRIVAKDEASRLLLPGLAERHRHVLALAGRAYAGDARDDWSELRDVTAATAAHLAGLVRAGQV